MGDGPKRGRSKNGPQEYDRDGNRLPWVKMRTLYETDERETYGTIADRFGSSKSAVARRARREGWRQGRERFQSKVREQAIDNAAREISALAVEHLEHVLGELKDHCSEAIARRRRELDPGVPLDHMDVDEKSVVEREHLPATKRADGTLEKGDTVTRRTAKQKRRRVERFDEVALRGYLTTLRALVTTRGGEIDPEDDVPPVEVE